MDREALKLAMKESISNVLETMFFQPIEPAKRTAEEDLCRIESQPLTVARLNFSGPIEGTMRLCIPDDLARSLTANFLGCEEDDITQRQIGQTVEEVLNMIAGNTFSELDEDAVYDLQIPEKVQFRVRGCHDGGTDAITLRFDTLDNFFILILNISDQRAVR